MIPASAPEGSHGAQHSSPNTYVDFCPSVLVFSALCYLMWQNWLQHSLRFFGGRGDIVASLCAVDLVSGCSSTLCLSYPSTIPLLNWSKIGHGFHKSLSQDWNNVTHYVFPGREIAHEGCVAEVGKVPNKRDLGHFQDEGQAAKVSWAWTTAVTAEVCLSCWVLTTVRVVRAPMKNAASLAASPEILNWSIWVWSPAM